MSDLPTLLEAYDLTTLQAIAYALGSLTPLATPVDLQPLVESQVAEEMHEELLGTVNQNSSRQARIQTWVNSVRKKVPYLLPNPSRGLSYMKNYFANTTQTSTEQAFWYSWLLAHPGSTDYEEIPNNVQEFDFPEDHGLHEGHRQEFWNLCGHIFSATFGECYVACRVWRKHEIPFEADHSETVLLKMSMFLMLSSGDVFELQPITLPVSMPVVHIQNSPFRILLGNQRFDSLYEASLFPMNVEWVEPEHNVELRLQLTERHGDTPTTESGYERVRTLSSRPRVPFLSTT